MVAKRKPTKERLSGAAAPAPKPVHYPESDGKPMGETETHIWEIIRLFQTLDGAFADRPDVYVGGDLLVYYEEGNPRAVVVPDVFVAFGTMKLPQRRIYKLWEEGVPPTVVIEVTSPSTRRLDQVRKRNLYARLGVREYVPSESLTETRRVLSDRLATEERLLLAETDLIRRLEARIVDLEAELRGRPPQ